MFGKSGRFIFVQGAHMLHTPRFSAVSVFLLFSSLSLAQAPGPRAGEAFQVNTYTLGSQARPSVATDEDGNFVVVWQSSGSSVDISGDSLLGQQFYSDGSHRGNEFLVTPIQLTTRKGPRLA